MKKPEEVKTKGTWEIVHKDKGGKVLGKQKGKNLVTTIGFNYFASRAANATPAQHPNQVSIGSGTASPLVSNTALQAQLGPRIAGTASGVLSELQVAAVVPGPGAGTYTVNEVGVHFLAAGAGNLVARFLIQQVILSPGETLEVSWNVRFGA